MPDMICYREAESDIASVDDVYNMCFLVTAIKKNREMSLLNFLQQT